MSNLEPQTDWNLSLLYSSETDPTIERDISLFEEACNQFSEKYKDVVKYVSDETVLVSALTDYEHLLGMAEASKPLRYYYFRKDINGADQKAESELNKISQRITKANNSIIFFELQLGTITKKNQVLFLNSQKLSHFRYFLERIFNTAQYNLSELEEKVLNLKSLPSHVLWTQGQQKLLGQQTVRFKGKDIPLTEAQNKISTLPTKTRRKLSDDCNDTLRLISHFAESEINAVYINKKINDELRGFTQPYSATILSYQNDEASIITFIQTVTEHFNISHAFYTIKSSLLKHRELEYADRSAKVGTIFVKPTFEYSVRIFKNALSKIDKKYVAILETYLENGQIDVYPKIGKKGGAYCAGDIQVPTFVLLNHVDTLDSLKTFAHEMGHAFHTEFSKQQSPLYQNYSTSVAEVASTFFENVVFDEVFETLSDQEKIIALHDRINDDISTIFRQTACFNFELEMHTVIREKGAISKEEIANLHNKHMKSYLGPLFNFKESDGYFFVSWPHLRYFFYVYAYAYGQLISKALYKKYKENPAYIHEIEKFLSAGGSKSPEQIFMEIGIDTTQPEFFIEGLRAIEYDIQKLAELTKK